MDASVRLFAKKGFELTTVQEIVDEADLTKGAFYHHFTSKDEVLLEIHEDFIDSLLERTSAVIEQELSPRETVEQLIFEMLASFEMFNEAVSVFFRERRSLSPESDAKMRVRRDQFEHILVELLDEGIRQGQFRPLPHVRLAAFGIVGMCGWAHEWFDPSREVSAAELATLYAGIIMEGLVQPPAPH